ncbi:LysR substrate-binding domain-containing protein [Rhizobium sp.]|uniref:LysR family transcriptional regulator n=1 Tax=Rhizobium sp. TaxID=391 RepID=UPI002AA64B19
MLNSPRRPPIELRHLRYFIAVAEELHFGRAALRLNIVQPALTAQIKALEQLIGVTLLERTKRRVELTDAGHQLLLESRSALAQIDTAIDSVKDVAEGITGTLRIGYGANAAATGVIPADIRRFKANWPNVNVELKEMAGSEVSTALVKGEIDIGYAAATSRIDRDVLQIRLIGEWPWMLSVSDDHPLGAAKSARIEDITHDRLAVYAEAEGRLDMSSLMAALPNLTPQRVHLSSHIVNLMTYVATGLAVAFVPAPIAKLAFPGVRFLTVDGNVPHLQMNMLWPKQATSPVVRNFLASVER